MSAGPREALLDDVVAYAQAHGLSDVSLRTLATAIGSSHRMLIYHFGSREGLLAAVVQRVEARQREVLGDLVTEHEETGPEETGPEETGPEDTDHEDAGGAQHTDPVTVTRRMWQGLADPSMHESERLFFEVVAMALRGRPGTEQLRASLVEPWLARGEDAARALGLPPTRARAQARLGMAVMRGLLLDLLATGDRAGVDEAMELFVAGLQ